MKKLLLILSFILAFTFVKAQNPVNITQPYNFLKWIKVKDSIRCTIYFQNANDTLATKKYVRDLRVNPNLLVFKSDSGSLFLTPYQTTVLLNGKISIVDSLTKYVTHYQLTQGLSAKVDKVTGKKLTDKNYTSTDSLKLAGLNNNLYRPFTIHETYDSLLNKPNLSAYKLNNDSVTNPGFYTNYKALSKLNVSDRGADNGVASLVNGKVPLSQMNAALIGSVKYQGTYNASTNTPNLPNADTTKGWYFIVSVSGTQSGLTYGVGDWVISNGVQWGRVKTTAYSIMYEISVTTAGVTTFMIPFPLTDISNVYYNGNSISSDMWSGVGTTSITLNADTRVYDKIKIQN